MLTGALTILLLLIVLLAIPVTLTYDLHWHQAIHSNIKLRWLFGLVRLRHSYTQSKAQPKPPSQESKETPHKIHPVQDSSSKKSRSARIIWHSAFRRRIIRFARDFWHAVQKRNVILRIRIGLGDPADTGQLWAVVGPVAGILSNAQEATIDIVPEFFDNTFELDSNGSMRLIPLQLIYLGIALLLSPSVWQGIKLLRAVEQ